MKFMSSLFMYAPTVLRNTGGSILLKRANKYTSMTLAVIILKCTKWESSMCKRSVDIGGQVYHGLITNWFI